ncbi:hypothetical protein CDAR_259911 [Caerostris darwini]|uniref:Uncharacterized protein n=1 Tax=Caerostris darwini TaxID=1538125 RepID=A0AAV4Q491_9ARAC|nr:hypothetical protein CDAR_259911 [Caerostris darwini]
MRLSLHQSPSCLSLSIPPSPTPTWVSLCLQTQSDVVTGRTLYPPFFPVRCPTLPHHPRISIVFPFGPKDAERLGGGISFFPGPIRIWYSGN